MSKNDGLATIEVDKNEFNFGKIKVNDTVDVKFKLKNSSSNSLIIKKIKTSCGCTVAKLKDSLINPNDYAVIEAKFISDNDNKGTVSKSIVIEANTQPNFTVLYLKGKVE
ncbi:DUF1573 domain-containing protein [Flavobacterium macrobrachii]|uniref:DUF1573 domain-containing protein n=1 Tax=Flavobacterium macrobrachii TaxID=591204 RepID=A0ABS2CW34_9FLAO|nr:DUF1573 domain-containing protein [Flavobacterium macrobrachii]MBM6499173.1 DUF1573 domain-containing protein [Flavobacterium macrobrachii]